LLTEKIEAPPEHNIAKSDLTGINIGDIWSFTESDKSSERPVFISTLAWQI
jgi:hypothetical protein